MRYEINKNIKRVDNIVPMKMLLIDYTCHILFEENQDFDMVPKLKSLIKDKLNEILKGEIEQHQICRTSNLKNIECIHKELDNAKIIFCGEYLNRGLKLRLL